MDGGLMDDGAEPEMFRRRSGRAAGNSFFSDAGRKGLGVDECRVAEKLD